MGVVAQHGAVAAVEQQEAFLADLRDSAICSAGKSGESLGSICIQVPLIEVHMSVVSVVRMVRALRRAVLKQETMLEGLSGSRTR